MTPLLKDRAMASFAENFPEELSRLRTLYAEPHRAYHNWTHGFHVANSIYSILKASPGIFKPLEVVTIFVI